MGEGGGGYLRGGGGGGVLVLIPTGGRSRENGGGGDGTTTTSPCPVGLGGKGSPEGDIVVDAHTSRKGRVPHPGGPPIYVGQRQI